MSEEKSQHGEKEEYDSLKKAIEKCSNKPLSKIPPKLRKRISDEFPEPWDNLSEDERISRAVRLDFLSDPSQRDIAERQFSVGYKLATNQRQIDKYKFRPSEKLPSEERERRKLVEELESDQRDNKKESNELSMLALSESQKTIGVKEGSVVTEKVAVDGKAEKHTSNVKTIDFNGHRVNFPIKKGSVTKPVTYKKILDLLAFWSEAEEALKRSGTKQRSIRAVANQLAMILKAKKLKDHRGGYPDGAWIENYYKLVKKANPGAHYLFTR